MWAPGDRDAVKSGSAAVRARLAEHVVRLIVWIAEAPPDLVRNEVTVTHYSKAAAMTATRPHCRRPLVLRSVRPRSAAPGSARDATNRRPRLRLVSAATLPFVHG